MLRWILENDGSSITSCLINNFSLHPYYEYLTPFNWLFPFSINRHLVALFWLEIRFPGFSSLVDEGLFARVIRGSCSYCFCDCGFRVSRTKCLSVSITWEFIVSEPRISIWVESYIIYLVICVIWILRRRG